MCRGEGTQTQRNSLVILLVRGTLTPPFLFVGEGTPTQHIEFFS
jgi:hypothetical protein